MTTTAPRPVMPGQRELGHSAASRLYRGQTHYDFINRWKTWFVLSGLVIVIGMGALAIKGLNFSIDFKGGTSWEVPTHLTTAEVKKDLGPLYTELNSPTIVTLTNRQTGQVNVEVEASAKSTSLAGQVQAKLAQIAKVPSNAVTVDAVGASWGSDISNKAIEAVVVFLVLISLCIAGYFESRMALAALVALLHDMLVTVGIYALSGFQVSPDTVIAFLTVLGYSLYDTIVVFDKVKENTKGLASTNRFTYTDVVNVSMNQVLARSINTSFVAIMPVFCILVIGSWIMGASALNDFGLALFIGLMSGAYSSIFIASPILALLKEREPRYSEIRRKLAQYPQARQYLSPSTVAGGSFIGNRSGTESTPFGVPTDDLGPPVSAAGPGLAGTGATRSQARAPGAGPRSDKGGSLPNGAGATQGGSAGTGAGSRPVPGARKPGTGRSAPPPRKKAPRRP